jgi:hypothetical protein
MTLAAAPKSPSEGVLSKFSGLFPEKRRSIAPLLWPGDMCAYRMAMFIPACPMSSCMVRISTPLITSQLAKVWSRTCGPIILIRRFLARCNQAVKPLPVQAAPFGVTKTTGASPWMVKASVRTACKRGPRGTRMFGFTPLPESPASRQTEQR